jgi:hypothetical protein
LVARDFLLSQSESDFGIRNLWSGQKKKSGANVDTNKRKCIIPSENEEGAGNL